MVIISSIVNKVLVELFFLFILSGTGTYPMDFEMTDSYNDKYIITVESEGDNFNITVSAKSFDEVIYAEWYDVFLYRIYQEGVNPYLIDLSYFFEIELTENGFPEQTFDHAEGGDIYLHTVDRSTVIKYIEKGITLKIDNVDYGME